MRPIPLFGTVVATLAAAVLLPVPPAHAVTTYTWQGTESSVWGNKKNWQPEGVPQNGDSVQLSYGPRPTITEVPDIQLAMLTVTGSTDGLVSMSGPGEVITGSLQWNGGDINTDLMVSAPPGDPTPSYIMMGQVPMRFGYGPDSARTLTINSTVSLMSGPFPSGDTWLTFMFDSNLRIASTGKLLVDPAAKVAANRCCVGPTSTVIVDGTLEVFSATGATGYTARFDELGFDLAGDVVVPKDNTLEITGGPIRVGGHAINGTVGDASVKGGGTVDVNETDGDAYDPEHPLLPDGTMKFIEDGEKLTLADKTTLRLGPYSEVSGIGSIVGDGSVRLAGTSIRGRLTIADGVPATTEPGTRTNVEVYDKDYPAQTGWLTPAGGLRIEPGSRVRVMGGGGRLIVPKDATLELPEGAALDSGGCCTDTGRVTLQKGATMKVGQESAESDGDPAELSWIELGGQGTVEHTGSSTWDLAGTAFTSGARITGEGTITGDLPAGPAEVEPTGVLTVDGDLSTNQAGSYRPLMAVLRSEPKAAGRLVVTGNAALSGRLRPIGDTTYAPGRRIVVLEAGSISGGFRCAVAGGMILDPAATDIGLRSIEAHVSDCLRPAPRALLSAAFSGTRKVDLGLPDSAVSVLVDVTASGATRGATLKLSAGRGTVIVQVPKRRTLRRQLEVPVAPQTKLTVQLTKRARLKIGQVGYAF